MIDLKYAYMQLNLHTHIAKHCNSNSSGDITGTYRIKTDYCGLTDKTAEFKKAMDNNLISLKNSFCFL